MMDKEKQIEQFFDKAEELHIMKENEKALTQSNKGFETLETYLQSESLDTYILAKASKAYIVRAEINSGLNKMSDALDDLNKAVQLFEDHLELIPIAEQKKYPVYFSRGLCHKKKGDFSAAIDDLTTALKQHSEDFEAYAARGICYMNLGKTTEAIKDFDDSIKINDTGKNTKAYFNRGNCYYQNKNHDNMYKDFDKIIKLARWPIVCCGQIGISARVTEILAERRSVVNISNAKQCFYKYIPIIDYQVLSIINHEVYFCDSTTLNDPLECCLMKTSEWFNYCLEQGEIKPRILALMSDPENKLMYSHYAESHKGLCVEYDIDIKNLPEKVSYGKVKYENGKNSVENIRDLYMLKNKEWKYEDEFRLVRFDNEEFMDVEIKSITFGYKCIEDHKKIIITIFKTTFEPKTDYKEPKYFEMKQVGDSNELQRVELKSYTDYYLNDRQLFRLMQKYNLENLFHYKQKQDEKGWIF
jgi:tetratricopeptide (TPR) repeat protein